MEHTGILDLLCDISINALYTISFSIDTKLNEWQSKLDLLLPKHEQIKNVVILLFFFKEKKVF